MKNKIAKITAFAFTTLLGLGALVSVGSAKIASAAQGIPIHYVDSPFTDWDGSIRTTVPKGFQCAVPKDSGKAWIYSSTWSDFSIHDVVDVEFAIDFYDGDDGAHHASNNGDGLDIYFYKDNGGSMGGFITMLRIWTASGSKTNGNHSTQFMDVEHGWASYGQSGWIVGDANTNSSFKLRISKEKGIQYYSTAGWDYEGCNDPTYAQTIKNALADTNKLWISFQGDNGFSAETKVIIKKTNGISYENDGIVFTNTAPVVTFSETKSINAVAGSKFTLPAIKAFGFDQNIANKIGYRIGDDTLVEKTYEQLPATEVTYDFEGDFDLIGYVNDGFGNLVEKTIQLSNVAEETAEYFASWILRDRIFTDLECYEKYSEAKARLINYEPTEIEDFQTNTKYADSRARYEAWCRANGDLNPYAGTVVPEHALFGYGQNQSGNVATILIVITLATLCACVSLLLLKKKKHN